MFRIRDRVRPRCILGALAGSAVAASAVGAETDDEASRVKALVGLKDLQVVELDVDQVFDKEIVVVVPIDGQAREIVLYPYSTRSPNYQVLVHDEDGYTAVEPTPAQTMRGHVAGEPDSSVAASLLDDGLHAWIQVSSDEQYWVEPMSRWIPGAEATEHILYTDADAEHLGGQCGTAGEHIIRAPEEGEAGGVAGGGLCVTELACDADFEYFQDWGSVQGVENRINQVINTMNLQYENQCGITHEIGTIIVRTTPGAPYTSTDAQTLLAQFRSHWINNQGGVQRDVAKLFTGKNLNGGIIGIAWTIGSICSNFSSYCLSESDFNGNFACATDLAAHELGHLWGAFHCGCPNHTMNSFITCANQFTQGSINSITAEINQSPCVDCSGPTGPENDDCDDAIALSNGNTSFSTVGATTDGPPLPGACDEGFGTDFGSDVWYTYVPTCSGTLTVSTCSQANYDTRLAAYIGNCGNLTLIACNDDGPGCADFTSEMTVPVTCGELVLVRVGGFGDASGSGTLSVSCSGACDPPDVEMVAVDVLIGANVSGGIAQLLNSDDSYLTADSVEGGPRNNSLAVVTFESSITTVSQLDFTIEVGPPDVSPVFRSFALFDYETGFFTGFRFGIIPGDEDTVYTFSDIANPNRYVSDTGEIQVRIGWTSRTPQTPDGFTMLIDHVSVSVEP